MKVVLSLFTIIFLLLNFSLSSLRKETSLHYKDTASLYSADNSSFDSSLVFEEEIEDNIIDFADLSIAIESLKNEFFYQSVFHKIFIFDYKINLPCLFDLPPPSLT